MRRKERRIIWCACGCKTALETPDSEGRERRFISGHNSKRYKGKWATRWGASKRWAKTHPLYIRNHKRAYHRKRKVLAIKHLNGMCKSCGLKYDGTNGSAFEFHHRKPQQKSFTVGNALINKNWITILTELKKCDLLCANCHNLHHGGKW